MYSSDIVPVSVLELSLSSPESSEDSSLSSLQSSLEVSSALDVSSDDPDSNSFVGSFGSLVGCRLCLV